MSADRLTDDEIAEIREIYSHYDDNGNGVIEVGELAALLDALGAELTSGQLDAAMKSLDTDGSGKIEFDEFVAWWADH